MSGEFESVFQAMADRAMRKAQQKPVKQQMAPRREQRRYLMQFVTDEWMSSDQLAVLANRSQRTVYKAAWDLWREGKMEKRRGSRQRYNPGRKQTEFRLKP